VKRLLCLGILLAVLGCAERKESPADVRLEDLRGQWVVINYWAQWCKPCIEEIPELNALDQKYNDVTVLGVNYDGATGVDLAQQREALGVAFPSLAEDPAAQLGVPRPVVLPTSLIVDPGGQVIATLLGPQTLETLEQATRDPANGVPE